MASMERMYRRQGRGRHQAAAGMDADSDSIADFTL